MLTIALCDDEADELAGLKKMLAGYLSARHVTADIAEYGTPDGLLCDIEEGKAFDLYLLDIIMEQMDGIALARQIRKTDPSGIIIYLTSSEEFALAGYEVRAFHYLLKPVDARKFYAVLDDAVALVGKRTDGIHVRTKSGTVRLLFDEIYYVEHAARCARYVCKERIVDSLKLTGAFKESVAPLLSDSRFFLCGVSLVVNLRYIRSVEPSVCTLMDGQKIYPPSTTIAALTEAWSNYWLERGQA